MIFFTQIPLSTNQTRGAYCVCNNDTVDNVHNVTACKLYGLRVRNHWQNVTLQRDAYVIKKKLYVHSQKKV